jgi:hypothetical protein
VTYLLIRISENDGNPWKIDLDNLAREDATGRERALADELETTVKAYIRAKMKPGSERPQKPIEGSRV